jgi:hypothetical protein
LTDEYPEMAMVKAMQAFASAPLDEDGHRRIAVRRHPQPRDGR